MKRVLLRFFSENNLGDDLFVKIVTQRYKNQFKTFTTHQNEFLNSIENLKVIKKSQKYFLFQKLLARALKKRYPWLQAELKRNDLFLYIGGSIFAETDGVKPWEREVLFYRQCRVPFYILGSNVGPYKDKEFLVILKEIFNLAKDVCFRDEISYNLFKNTANVRMATDVAFTLDISKYDKSNNRVAILSIIDGYKHFTNDISEQYEQKMAEMTNRLTSKGYRVVLMSFWKAAGDLDAVNRILSMTNPSQRKMIDTFSYEGDLETPLALIAKSEIVIGTRFHAVILGLLFKKKVLPIAYSDKTINVLNDMKFKGQVIDMRKISTFNTSSIDPDLIEIQDIEDQIDLAQRQFQELDKVLERN